MNQLLTIGETLHTKSSALPVTVREFIGSGGQGEVYGGEVNGQVLAIKWFFPHYEEQDLRLRERLARAVEMGPPSDRFLWPLELVTAAERAGFGYLMALREPRFAGMADLMMRRVEPSIKALTTTGYELAHSYLQLHAQGLCYRDISFGNVFFEPATGEVRICDNDNVDIDGQPGTIGGTPRFMAPELVRGEATPSTESDLHSLAVLLFYLLLNHHPLEGAKEAAIHCFDLPAMTKLYGTEPRFIFDPQDASNRPLAGYHDNALAFWPIYPSFLQQLFTRAFTEGLDGQRVRESEWRSALLKLRDACFYCSQCGAENFYNVDALRASGRLGNCWSCQHPQQLPTRIRIGHSLADLLVMLNHDTQLFPHHLDERRAFDFSEPLAQIQQHPQKPQIWGLKNLGKEKWTAIIADGTLHEVPPGRNITLAAGTRIHFGNCEGEIRM